MIKETRLTNLRTLVSEAGSVAELARQAKKSDSQINQILNGVKSSSGTPRGVGNKLARDLEQAAGKPEGWMDVPHTKNTLEVRENSAAYENNKTIWQEPDPKKYRTIKVMRFSASAGVSGAPVEYFEDEDEPLFFKNAWFEKRGIDPDKSAAMKVIGESMEPLLSPGDTVLVNTDENTPRHDKVFVICVDGELVVKRLIEEREGWTLHSDNPTHRPRPVTDNTQIIGRVRWIGRDEL